MCLLSSVLTLHFVCFMDVLVANLMANLALGHLLKLSLFANPHTFSVMLINAQCPCKKRNLL